MTQKTVNLKQLLRAFTLGVALIVGASSVFAQNASTAAVNQPAGQEIGARWESSPEYQEYLKLGGEKSAEARAIKERVITGITRQVLSAYIQGFDPKYRELMDRKVKELPIGLQVLLGNIDIRIKEKIKLNYDSMAISRLNTYMFNFVDSIYKYKGVAEKNLSDITEKFPELTGLEITKTLRNIAKTADNSADNLRQSEAWERINEMLKSIK